MPLLRLAAAGAPELSLINIALTQVAKRAGVPVLALGLIERVYSRNGKPNTAAAHDLGAASAALTYEATARGMGLAATVPVGIANGLEVGLRLTYGVDATSGKLLLQRPLQDRVSDRLQLVTGWQNLLAGTAGE